jgi:uncharacterized lipoprotein YajG
MKKILLALSMVALLTSCDTDKQELNNIIDEMAASKDEKKQDPNFRIFNDHYQIGKNKD